MKKILLILLFSCLAFAQDVNFNNTTPAAPADHVNVDFQSNSNVPIDLTANVRTACGNATVWVKHATGGCSLFQASADTDVARGNALYAAYGAAGDGDTIFQSCQVNGKFYDLGTNHLEFSKGNTITINLTGCGDQSLIKSVYVTGNGQGVITPGKVNWQGVNITVWGFTADDTFSANWVEPFGIGVTDTVQPVDAVCINCHIIGTNDGLIWFNAVTAGITFYGGKIECTYDCTSINIPVGTGVGAATGYVRFYDTRFVCAPDTYGQCNEIKTAGYDATNSRAHPEFIVAAWNISITVSGAPTGLTSFANAQGVTVNLHSGWINDLTSSGTYKHVAQSNSGVMNIGCSFNYNIAKTNGTITRNCKGGFGQDGSTTVGSLGTCGAATAFARIGVTDSTAVATEGQTCVGGSSNSAYAICIGSTWKCF
jgi:hypothetical protein